MLAAIYARKSTEQTGAADDQKSVALELEHARMCAQRKGWRADDTCVLVGEGISRGTAREGSA